MLLTNEMQKDIWQTFGHTAAKTILNKQIASGRMPHAYLFAGSKGLGKKTLALEFSQKVLGAEKLSTHPDFAILDQTGEITMEAVLNFISRLSYKPFFAQKKIAIINNADNLNQQSGNALLKTLEEASPSTIIILISQLKTRLLPTVVSRCQVFNFHQFGKHQLLEFAKENKLQTTPLIEELSFGSPARLKKLCLDKEFLESEEKTLGQYRSFTKMRLGEKLLSISGLAELETEDLRENLLTWLMWQSGQLAAGPQDYQKVSALGESLLGLRQNKNKKLVLQSLLLKI